MVSGLERRLWELRNELALRDTAVLAQKCGMRVGDEQFFMRVWGDRVSVKLPDFTACCADTQAELDPMTQALVIYYLYTSDGSPAAEKWIAFTDLPDGRFYTKAFQGYTGSELAQEFGDDIQRFAQTAVACGGKPESFPAAAFRFQALPKVPVLVVCWQGDEDFPASFKILFDAHTSHHLPTDACAIMGSMLTRRLLR